MITFIFRFIEYNIYEIALLMFFEILTLKKKVTMILCLNNMCNKFLQEFVFNVEDTIVYSKFNNHSFNSTLVPISNI